MRASQMVACGLALGLLAAAAGCGGDELAGAPLGASCQADADCNSRVCSFEVCVAAAADVTSDDAADDAQATEGEATLAPDDTPPTDATDVPDVLDETHVPDETGLDELPVDLPIDILPEATEIGPTASDGSGDASEIAASVIQIRIDAPLANVTAGTSFSLALTALDVHGNVAPAFTGQVSFRATDPSATLPPPRTFAIADQGHVVVTGFALATIGSQTVSVVNPETNAAWAHADILVQPALGPAVRLAITGPSSVSAGVPFAITVTAFDALDQVASGFAGHLVFTSSDDGATLPAPADVNSVDAGTRTFSGVQLTRAGASELQVTDGVLTASLPLTVRAVDAAHLAIVDVAPAPAAAGVPLAVTVEARDAFGNVASDYRGTVVFSASDEAATFPEAYVFSASDAGVATVGGLVLRTAGSQTVVVTDVAVPSVAGAITLSCLEGSERVLILGQVPAATLAGETFSAALEVTDTLGNRITGYAGTVHFAASDARATLPADYTFTAADGGLHVFSGLALTASGTTTIDVEDTAEPGLATQALVNVTALGPARLLWTGLPAEVVAGSALDVTVTALDAYDNVATQASGSLALAASDAQATLPAAPVSFETGAGLARFTVTLQTAGPQTLSATLGGARGDGATRVTPAEPHHLVVSPASGTVAAGAPFALVVAARDRFENVTPAYAGTVQFEVDAGVATLPASAAFADADAGRRTFEGVVLTLAGERTVSVRGTGLLAPAAATAQRLVVPGAVDHLAIEAPSALGAGEVFPLEVTASDAFANVVSDYQGTVAFELDTPPATLPSAFTFLPIHGGHHRFEDQTLERAGQRTITARDLARPGVVGSALVAVAPADAHHLALTPATGPVTAGQSFSVTVTVEDPFGNTATAYTGEVGFAADLDSRGHTMPASHVFAEEDAGVFAFGGFVLATAGDRTLTATGTGAGAVQGVVTRAVAAAPAVALVLTPASGSVASEQSFTLHVAASDAYGNRDPSYRGTVAFSVDAGGGTVPPVTAFTESDRGARDFTFSLSQAGSRTITASDTSASAIQGTATRTVTATAVHHFDVSPPAGEVSAGEAFDLVVTAKDAAGNTVTDYQGEVRFGVDEGGGNLPPDTLFAPGDRGQRTFPALTLTKVGPRIVTIVDTTTATTRGTVTRTVSPGIAATLALSPPTGTTTAGAAFDVTVSALDAYGNVATGYRGTVGFSVSGKAAAESLPDPYAFVTDDRGVHRFEAGALLTVAGARSLSAIDLASATLTGTALRSVTPAAAATLGFDATSGIGTAGTSWSLTLTAKDTYGNVATGYTGTVDFSVAGPPLQTGESLPPAYTFTAADAGAHTFLNGFRLTRVGTSGPARRVTATPASGGPAVYDRTVTPLPAVSLAFDATSGSGPAGTPFSLTLSAKDTYGNVATDFAGTALFSVATPTLQTGETLPQSYTFVDADKGVRAFPDGFNLTKVGAPTSRAVKATSGTLIASYTRTVTQLAASALGFSSQSSSGAAGSTFSLTLSAYDAYGNVATAYAGSVTLDIAAPALQASELLPTSHTFTGTDAGVYVFSVRLNKAGTPNPRTITAAPTGGALTAATHARTVVPGAMVSLAFDQDNSSGDAGSTFSLALSALDSYGNVATSFVGSVFFSTEGTYAGEVLPGNTAFTAADAGTHVFTDAFTLSRILGPEARSIRASNALGSTTHYRTLAPRAASRLAFSAASSTGAAGASFDLTLDAFDPYGNKATGYTGTVTFAVTNPTLQIGETLPADFTFAAADAGRHTFTAGSLLTKRGVRGVTVTDLGDAALSATHNRNVTSLAATRLAFVPNSGSGAVNSIFSLTATAYDSYDNVATGYGGYVSLIVADPPLVTGELAASGATCSVGTCAFGPSFRLTKVGTNAGARTITITDNVTAFTATYLHTVQRGPIETFAFDSASGTGTAGSTWSLTLKVADAYANPISDYTGTVAFTVADPALATGELLPALYTFTTGDAGQHVFTDAFMLSTAGTRLIKATDAAIARTATYTRTVTVGAATALAWAAQPSTVAQGETMSSPPRVRVIDAWGNQVAEASRTIALQLAKNPARGRLGGTYSATTSTGIRGFAPTVSRFGDGYALAATSSGLTSALSNPFEVTALAPLVTNFNATFTSGCIGLNAQISHPTAEPTRVALAFDGEPLTVAGSDVAGGRGSLIRTTASPAPIAFTWDSPADVPELASGTLELKATVGARTTTVTTAIAVDNRWKKSWTGADLGASTGLPTTFSTQQLAAADLNRDGRADLILPAAGANPSLLVLYFGPGASTFTKRLYDLGLDAAAQLRAVASADFDGDGDVDVVLGDRASDRIVYLRSDATATCTDRNADGDCIDDDAEGGGATLATLLAAFSGGPCGDDEGTDSVVTDLAVADFDKNGRPDLAVLCTRAQKLVLWGNVANSAFMQVTSLPIAANATSLAVADLDRDGFPDLFIGHPAGVAVTRVTVTTPLTWGLRPALTAVSNVADLEVADLDRDGWLDLVTTSNDGGGGMDVVFGTGLGTFAPTASRHATSCAVGGLTVGDVDGNGARDLIGACSSADKVTVKRSSDWRGGASGETEDLVTTGTAAGYGPSRVLLLDLDRDGNPDIVTSRNQPATGTPVGYVRNLGRGKCTQRFDGPTPTPALAFPTGVQLPLDVNGDGKLDLLQVSAIPPNPAASGNVIGEGMDIVYGRGDGRFRALAAANDKLSTDAGPGNENPRAVVSGDFDSDGDLDLAAIVPNGTANPALRLYKQASGVFTSSDLFAAWDKTALVAGDLDLNGDDDLAYAYWTGSAAALGSSLQSGNALGGAGGPNVSGLGAKVSQLATADLNRDGILDFVLKREAMQDDLCTVVSTAIVPAGWPSAIDVARDCLSTGASEAYTLALADIDRDGRADVVLSQGGALKIYLTQRDDSGTLVPIPDSYPGLSLGCPNLGEVSLDDLDQDGLADVLARCDPGLGAAPGAAILRHTGIQTAASRFAASHALGFAESDGFRKLVTAGLFGFHTGAAIYDAIAYHVVTTTPLTLDTPAATPVTDGAAAQWLLSADLDRDGRRDTVASAFGLATLWVTSDVAGDASVIPYTPSPGGMLQAIGLADMDGDGRREVVAGYRRADSSFAMTLLAPSSDASLLAPQTVIELSASPSFITGMSLGVRDTAANAIAVDGLDALVIILDGATRDALSIRVTTPTTTVTLSAPADNSYVPDTVTALSPITLQRRTANGVVEDQPALLLAGQCLPSGYPCTRVVGLSKASASGPPDGLELLHTATLTAYPGRAVAGLVAVDFDHDGAEDFALLFSRVGSGSELRWFQQSYNSSTGLYFGSGGTTASLNPASYGTALAAADMNGDGWLDLVVSQSDLYESSLEVLYLTAWFGALPTPHDFVATGHEVDAFGIWDFDGDGKPDIVTLDGQAGSIRPLRWQP